MPAYPRWRKICVFCRMGKPFFILVLGSLYLNTAFAQDTQQEKEMARRSERYEKAQKQIEAETRAKTEKEAAIKAGREKKREKQLQKEENEKQDAERRKIAKERKLMKQYKQRHEGGTERQQARRRKKSVTFKYKPEKKPKGDVQRVMPRL